MRAAAATTMRRPLGRRPQTPNGAAVASRPPLLPGQGHAEDRYAEVLEQRHLDAGGGKAGGAGKDKQDTAGGEEGGSDGAVKPEGGGEAAGAGGAAASAPAPAPAKKSKKEGKGAAAEAAQAEKGAAFRLHPGDRAEPQVRAWPCGARARRSPRRAFFAPDHPLAVLPAPPRRTQHWTPHLSEAVINQWVQDCELRADLAPTAGPTAVGGPTAATAGGAAAASTSAPSCCFFTFANTRQSMNCAAFSLPAHLLAAGFADSSVRLWDLSVRSSLAGGGGGGGGGAAGKRRKPGEEDDGEDPDPGVTYLYGHTGGWRGAGVCAWPASAGAGGGDR